MSSYMTALGFLVTTEQDFRHYVYQATEFGQEIASEHGSYTVWSPGKGIELWVQTNLHKRILGMNLHFSGKTRMRVKLTMRIPRYEQSRLDGAFHGWIEADQFPLIFDLPDYDTYSDLALPTPTVVQLAAFAHNMQGFENEVAYLARLGKQPTRSFIPSGLVTKEKNRATAQAQAILSGNVLATEMITNPITGQQFYWAKVQTLGGEIDVVADPQVVQGKIVKGGIVRGLFWLSGRLM